MARRRDDDGGFVWPPGLDVFDPECGLSLSGWHLERARVAPSKLAELNEVRAAAGRPPIRVWET